MMVSSYPLFYCRIGAFDDNTVFFPTDTSASRLNTRKERPTNSHPYNANPDSTVLLYPAIPEKMRSRPSHFIKAHKWGFVFCGNAKSDGLSVSKEFIRNASQESEALRLALQDANKTLNDPRYLGKRQIR